MTSPAPHDLWDNPLGTDGFEFIEYAAPDPAALGRLFEQMGFTAVAKHRSKNVLLYRQGDDQLHRQRGARLVRAVVRARTRPVDLRDRVPRRGCGARVSQVRRERRVGRREPSGTDGAQHPGDQGHRRFADLSRRPLSGRAANAGSGVSIYDIDFVPLAGRRPASAGAGLTYIDHLTHNVHRGRMDRVGELLRAPVQFPRGPLFRHRRQADGTQVEGDDEPLRQDPHPDQRELRRQEPDPGIPGRLSRRGHPARRARHRRHPRDGRGAARAAASRSRTRRIRTTSSSPTRLPGHGEDELRLARNRILIDGAPAQNEMLLQIFTKTVIGPIFFEIIQRKGNAGLRRRQLPGAVRVHRTGPGAARGAVQGLIPACPVRLKLGLQGWRDGSNPPCGVGFSRPQRTAKLKPGR